MIYVAIDAKTGIGIVTMNHKKVSNYIVDQARKGKLISCPRYIETDELGEIALTLMD